MKFDGDPQQLGSFLAHVLTYMQEYSHNNPTEETKGVNAGTRRGHSPMDGEPPHNANSPQLRNFNCFMTALRWQFEDQLANWKARHCIKTVQQGCRMVAEYTEEFHGVPLALQGRLWPAFMTGACCPRKWRLTKPKTSTTQPELGRSHLRKGRERLPKLNPCMRDPLPASNVA